MRAIFNRDAILRRIAIVHDIIVAWLAFAVANLIAHGPDHVLQVSGIWEKSLAFIAIYAICGRLVHLNQSLWRYASISDLIAILKAATLTVVVFTLANFMLSRAENISRVATILSWFFLIAGLSFGRIAYRMLRERTALDWIKPSTSWRGSLLLYPFSDATETYVRTMRRLDAKNFAVAGIIDANPVNAKHSMHSLKVLGRAADIPKIVRNRIDNGTPIEELIVTDPDISGPRLTELLEACNEAGIGISRLPAFTDANRGELLEPRPVRLEDLLNRHPVTPDFAAIASLANGADVMITGAGGSIGSELVRQLAGFSPRKLILVENSELNLYRIATEFHLERPGVPIETHICDIRDSARIRALMQATRPKAVFHAAALKHVAIVEHNPLEGIKTNLLGTAAAAKAAVDAGVEIFVLISTDKAVNPSSVMGATKRAAEIYCLALNEVQNTTRFRAVRFGNVLGSTGSVIPLFRRQIARGGPVTVTNPEATRFFMTIPEAVGLILTAASRPQDGHSQNGALFVLDMGEPIRIVDLARRLIQLAGYQPEKDIRIEFIGLKPGEKVGEELLNPDDDQIVERQTGYSVILTRTVSPEEMAADIEAVGQACATENLGEAMSALRSLVISYNPSSLSALDDTEPQEEM
ncbi:MAG: polysaccharide biosynthesis protein [Brucellaceae bacterium]|nr:polysaccharide biosynthesis protein [Brucellaceae bacterium]